MSGTAGTAGTAATGLAAAAVTKQSSARLEVGLIIMTGEKEWHQIDIERSIRVAMTEARWYE
jgi:hypothetical protein